MINFSLIVSNIIFNLHHMNSEIEKITHEDELKISEFQFFNFMNGGYKDITVVRRLFTATDQIKLVSKAFSKEFTELEALDELIDAALSYRKFLTENQKKR